MTTDVGTELNADPLDRLAARIREQEAVAAVVGLGYVGLPLLVGIHAAGFPVIGVDTDPAKIDGAAGRVVRTSSTSSTRRSRRSTARRSARSPSCCGTPT